MLKNYLKIAVRNLWKNKLFSFINIMGLGLAIPFALLSLIQLQDAFELDNFHPKADRIYRIVTDETPSLSSTIKYASSPFLLAERLKENYAAIEQSTKVIRFFGLELNNRIRTIDNLDGFYIDSAFFEMFSFELAKGILPIAPNTILLSHETAELFFKDVDPVGKSLYHATYGLFTVTGVLKPIKKSTQFKSEVMLSMATYTKFEKQATEAKSWADYNAHTFVLLSENADPNSIDLALNDLTKQSNEEIIFANKTHRFRKQAFKDISPDFEELRYNGMVTSLADLSLFFGLGLGIILLAGFNYTNLTLARSLSRAKEVGIRKVNGATRKQLIIQFIFESLIIAFFAFGIGVFLLSLLKGTFVINGIVWEVENQVVLWLGFIAFTLLLGLVAGALPSWVLSGLQPTKILKGDVNPASFGKTNFRKSLIVIQFIVTLSYVFQMVHLYSQVDYMATENENFNRKDIFNVLLQDEKYKPFVNELTTHKNVEKIGFSSSVFGGEATRYPVKTDREATAIETSYYAVDNTFVHNMQLSFVAGNNLPAAQKDSTSSFVLLNEHAVKQLRLGTPQEAVGKTILNADHVELNIVGVVKDFCNSRYQGEKEPIVFHHDPARFQVLSIKTTTNTGQATFTADVKTIWQRYYPTEEMGFSWYAQDLYQQYYPRDSMNFFGLIFLVILLIAVMGLLGIVTYTTEKRVKEIGIRKVIGASTGQITQTLSWGFVKMLLIAGGIALPIGYGLGALFLSLFTYHKGINFPLMAAAFFAIFGIALFTIGTMVIKAALANPVKSLRSE
jgi:putative ABC transport system permease protein